MSGAEVTSTTGKGRLLDWLDAIAKLMGALAVVAVAVIANSLQSKITGISIQSQREQADSQLRASMFTSLITPIMGSQKDGKLIAADREQLLAELLALNFHENFELKPLLEDASERLAAEADSKRKRLPGEPDVREPLWSIARRIAERQKASISREWTAYKSGRREKEIAAQPRAQGCEVYLLTLEEASPRHPEPIKPGTACQLAAAFRDVVDLPSPDGNNILRLSVTDPDWKNQKVKVSALPFLSKQEGPQPTDPVYAFPLTWFDLPLTDNTLLPDGNRFAFYLRTFYPPLSKIVVAVMWFPKGYFTPRERPLNYGEVQQLLGRNPQ